METSDSSITVEADLFNQKRLIGTVSYAGDSTLKILLSELASSSEQPKEFKDKLVPNVGKFVIIQHGHCALFARINGITSKPPRGTSHNGQLNGNSFVPFVTVQLVGTVSLLTGGISSTCTKPQEGSQVYLTNLKVVEWFFKNRSDISTNQIIFDFFEVPQQGAQATGLTPEGLFGRHCALLGTTGSGKSWTMARLIEEATRYRTKVLLLDATGEFADLQHGVKHLHLGTDPSPLPGSIEVAMPYYQLTESDLFAIFKPTGQSQGPKLRAAIRSLKLALVCPSLAVDGIIVKANKGKQHYETEYMRHVDFVESVCAEFDITNLSRQIENECVKPYRSPVEPFIWGDVNGIDHSYCLPLVTRIEDVIRSEELSPIFYPHGRSSLITELDAFFSDNATHVLRLSLEHLAFAHNAREIIVNALGRHILGLGRKGMFRTLPLVVFLDEAHQFLNKKLDANNEVFNLDSFEIIAKEGRKYSLTLCMATQRPRDIPEGVLSQMGTFIVHRLINDLDRSVVERAAGEIDHETVGRLPSLDPGEAVILGAQLKSPLYVNIKRPDAPPHSQGPNYQLYWR